MRWGAGVAGEGYLPPKQMVAQDLSQSIFLHVVLTEEMRLVCPSYQALASHT